MTPLRSHGGRLSSTSTDSLVSSGSSAASNSSIRNRSCRGAIRTPRLSRDDEHSAGDDVTCRRRGPAPAASPLITSGLISGDGLMLFITCFASLGVFLFGYDQGVMSGIITTPHFRSYFNNPPPEEIGTMVAVLEIGAFVTSLACGTLADVFGRKAVLFWGALVFSLGGAIQTLTSGFTIMVVGRITAGLGVGVMSMVVPTYQSEISPAENRGKLACIEFTGNIVGYSFSVWMGYCFSFLESHLSWRIPLSFQSVIGLTLCVGSLLLPESPRWLIDHDLDDEAMRVLADLHGNGDPRSRKAKREFREIKENVLVIREEGDERGRGYKEMFRRYKKRTFIACSAQMCAQLNGINVISYYAPNVFLSAGWVGRNAILMAGFNSISYLLSTIPTWFLVDSVGRRPVLLAGSLMCATFLTGMGGFVWLDSAYTAQAVVACVVLYDCAHGLAWGAIPWLLAPEIMPLSFRAKGASLATATNWLFNYIIGEMTPILLDLISWRLYIMHAGFCICSFLVVFFVYPETAGKSLEEMDVVFGDAINVEDEDDEDDDDDDDEDEDRVAQPIQIPGTVNLASALRLPPPPLESMANATSASNDRGTQEEAQGLVTWVTSRLPGRLGLGSGGRPAEYERLQT